MTKYDPSATRLRHAMNVLVVFVALLTSARIAHAGTRSDKEALAKAWLTAALNGTGIAPSKAQPLDYATQASPKSCKKVKAGRATSTKQFDRLRLCLRDALRQVTEEEGHDPDRDWWFVASIDAVPRVLARRVKALGKGVTVVRGHHLGAYGMNVDVFLVFSADDVVRVLWCEEDFYE